MKLFVVRVLFGLLFLGKLYLISTEGEIKGEGLYPAPTRKSIQELDAQIVAVQKGTKAAIPAMVPLHDILRQKFRWYYKWSTWPASKFINILILIIYLGGAGFFAYNFLNAPKKAVAATTTYNTTGVTNPAGTTSHKAMYGTQAKASSDPTPLAGTGELSTANYTTVSSTDQSFYSTAPAADFRAYQQFRFYVAASIDLTQVTNIAANNVGYASATISPYRTFKIWNSSTNSWESFGTSDSTASPGDTISNSVNTNSTTVYNYIGSSSRYIYFEVWGGVASKAGNAGSTIYTDKVDMVLTYNVPPAAPAITSPNTAVSWPLNSSANPVTWTSTATNQVEAQNLDLYDNFNDNSIDTNIWTTRTTSSNSITMAETGSEIQVSGTASGGTGGVSLRSENLASANRVYMAKVKATTLPNDTSWVGIHLFNGDSSKSVYIVYSGNSQGWRTGGTGLTQVAVGAFGNESTEYKTVKIVHNTLVQREHIYVYDADGTEHFITSFNSDLSAGGTNRFQVGSSALVGQTIETHIEDAMAVPINSIISENFDSYDNGSSINGQGGWTTTNVPANGTANVDNTQYVSTPKSLNITKTSTNTFYARNTFSSQTSNTIIEYDAKPAQTNAFFQLTVDGSGGATGVVNFNASGNITSSDGVTGQTLQAYSATWYHFKMVLDPQRQKYDIYIDGVLIAQNYGFYASNSSLTSFAIAGAFSGLGSLWIDNLQIYNEFKTIVGLSASGTSQTWSTTGWTAGTKYLARARTLASGLFGPWDYSDTTFTLYNVPATPTATAPSGAGIAVNPTATSSAFSGGGTHTASSWEIYDNADLAAAHRCWYKTDDASNLTSIVVNTTNGTFENACTGFTALANSTNYWGRVRHKNLAGNSSWATAVAFTTVAAAPPNAPDTITVDTIDKTTYTVHWADKSSDEEKFRVYSSTTSNATCSDATYGSYNEANANAISLPVSSKTPAKSYCIKVTAYKTVGGESTVTASSYSTEFWTLPNTPNAPTVNGATSTSLTIIIDTTSNDTTAEYAISCDDGTHWLELDGSACTDLSENWQTYTNWGSGSGKVNTGLGPNTSHTYKVKARNTNGTPDVSALGSGTTKYTLADTASAPTVTNTALTTSLNIAIAADTNPVTTKYAISCDTDSTFLNYTSNACEANADDADHWRTAADWGTFADTGLNANTNYTYKTRVRNGEKAESPSPQLSSSASLYTRIQVPVITIGVVTSTTIAMTGGTLSNIATGSSGVWFEETTQEVGKGGGNLAGNADFGTWLTTNSITDNNLIASTTYTYRAKAKNGNGTPTDFSTPDVSQATSAGTAVPTAPTIGSPTAISSTAIRWNFTDNASDETGFKVYDGLDALVATCASVDLTYCDETGLSVNNQYTGRYVVAYNVNGNSLHSATVASIYTLADTALAPTVTNTALTTSLNIAIAADTNPVSTEYSIYCNDTTNYLNAATNACGAIVDDTDHWKTAVGWGTFEKTGYLANTNHTYKIIARNGDKTERPLSSSASKYTRIEVPTGISFGTVDDTSIAISASGTLSNLATASSGLYFTQTSANPGGGGAGFLAWTQTNSLTDSGLTAGTQYSYKVKARNGNGTETAETAVFNQTTTNALAQPTNVALAVHATDSDKLELTWTDNAVGEQSYKVYVSTLANDTCSAATYPGSANYTTVASATSQTLTGLSVNTRYCAKVASNNGSTDGTPGYSAAPKYTRANVPGSSTLTALSTSSINVKLNKNGNPESSAETTETFIPNADGDRIETTIAGTSPASTHWQGIDDPVGDTDDSVTYNADESGGVQIDLFNLPSPSNIASGDTINSITVYLRNRSGRAPSEGEVKNVEIGVKENGVETYTSNHYYHSLWHLDSYAWSHRPSDGQDWTYNDITNLQIGYNLDAVNAQGVEVTQVYAVVDFTSNASNTQYAIGIDQNNNGSVDAGGWVQASGALGASAVWQGYSTWGGASGTNVTGLSVNTQYRFIVASRNGDNAASVPPNNTPGNTKYTHANQSSAPTILAQSWDVANGNAMQITLNANGNPNGTNYKTEFKEVTDNADCAVESGFSTYQDYTAHNNGDNLTHTSRIADKYVCYRLTARNGDLVPANVSSVANAQAAPAQPAGLGHTGNTISTITWDLNNNDVTPSGYQLLNAADVVTEVSATSDFVQNQYDDNPAHTLSVNTQYTVKTRAYRTVGSTIYGQPTLTSAAYTSIETPTGITSSVVSTGQIDVQVTNSLSNISAGSSGVQFNETQGNAGGGGQTGFLNATLPADRWVQAINASDTGLSANTKYVYTAKARNGDGEETNLFLQLTRYSGIEEPASSSGLVTPASIELNESNILSNMAEGLSAFQYQETAGTMPPGAGGQVGFWNAADPANRWTKNTTVVDTGIVAGGGNIYRYCVRARNADASFTTGCIALPDITPPQGELLLVKLPGQTWGITTDASGNQKITINGTPSIQTAGVGFDVELYAVKTVQSNPYLDLNYANTISLSCPTCPVNKVTLPSPKGMSGGFVQFNTVDQKVAITSVGTYSLTGAGSGGTSDEFVVKPGICSATLSTASANPTNLSTGSTSTISVTLSDAYGNKLSGHSVHVDTNQASDVFSGNDANTDSNGRVQISISSGLAHTSTLTATDTTDGVALSSHPQVTFTYTPPEDVSIDNPTNFTGIAGNRTTSLSWQNPGSANFSHIHIYRSTKDGDLGNRIADNINGEGYTDNNLTNGTTYYYTLKAVSDTGKESTGTYQLALTPTGATDNEPPTAPTNLRATDIGSSTISLAWDASRDNVGVVGYRIYNANTGIQIGASVDTNFDLSDLSPETTYKFYVKAYDAAGNVSAASNILTVTTLAGEAGGGGGGGYVCRNGGGKVAFLVLGNVPSEVRSGQEFQDNVSVRVLVADGGGELCEDYRGLVYFTSTDQKADLSWNKSNPYAFKKSDAGSHEFSGEGFKLNTVGDQILTVTDERVSGKAEVKVLGGVIFQKAQDTITDFYDKNASKVNTAIITTTTALLLTPALINIAIGLGNIIPQLLYWFTQLLQLLGIKKRRKPWGIIFNSQSGQPIRLAVVRIYDKEYNRMLEQAVTDSGGRFGFLARPGTFYIVVSKGGFTFPSQYKVSGFYENIYTGGNIEIKSKEAEAITLNIPLDPQTKVSVAFSLLATLVKINRFLQKIRIPLLIIGTVFAVIMIITSYHIVFVLSLLLYILLFILEYFKTKKARPYGVVSDVYGHPLEMAIVRIYEKKSGKLVETDVTDSEGRYKFLVEPGIYYLTATKPGYLDFKSHIMYLEKEQTLVSTNIKLKKVNEQ